MPFLVFYITCPTEKSAHDLAQHLLERRLVACANVFPISSAYWWQGAIQQEGEWVCIAKTMKSGERQVEAAVLGIHPYEVPCVMRFEARANAAYEEWIGEAVDEVDEVDYQPHQPHQPHQPPKNH
jgi:periplasmic divalent cation tolerance protein